MMTETAAAPDSLVKATEATGLPPARKTDLISAFGPAFCAARDIIEKSSAIVVTDATQLTEMQAAREARLKLQKVRTGADKLRVSLKAEYLATGKGIDNVAKAVMEACEAEEARLEACEKFAERAEAKRKAELKAARSEALSPFVPDTTIYPLGDMTEAAWAQLLEGSRAAHEARLAAAKKAEDDRIAAETARQAELAKAKAENERLRQQAEAEAKAQRERDRIAAEERAKLEAAAAAERAKAAEIERKARAEREAAEAKEHARVEAEAKAAAEKAAAERAAAAAPDADKLRAFAAAIRAVQMPELATPAGRTLADKIAASRVEFAAKVDAAATTLARG